ncbi:uncharacterized protein LOC119667257 [Teleopsis dalmanni]|uniref:uncharacterized protein LOC119667257 n=1 Tax=Teleopsis dalmanni TaxID=139649 RepID=UPI0018CE1103|nr:uncharacterized protein LOC119667257 [Teleopsis dalmanni]
MPCDNTKASSEIEHVDWNAGTGSGHHYANVRFGSGSSQASQSSGDICRICHCESDPQNPLLTPCYCSGSLKYVHQACLQQWLTASETNSCELCKFPFIMHTKIKPFNEWRSLDISGIERRRLCCSVMFHCAAALCVIWSLCVLIERAADDVQRGLIDWPFWTKLAVVTVGLTGGVVFMYIQCKAYLHLCHRWKARNRILLIQNAPEKIHPLSPPSPTLQHRNRHMTSNEPCSSTTNATTGSVEVMANVATASNAYNYANSTGIGGNNSEIDSATASHRLFNQSCSQTSPHHMLQPVDLDIDPLAPRTSSSGIHQQMQHLLPQQQVAVAANIECSQSQHNYERDWALDDVVSQISSFRPCPQGSGSMTPFHDSIHNVLENSEGSSRVSINDVCSGSRQDLSTGGISTDTGRDHALQLTSYSGSGEHKAPSISSGVSNAVEKIWCGFSYEPHSKRYSNSSIYIENRDILNDSTLGYETTCEDDFSQHNYRHSSILTPNHDNSDQLEKFLGEDLRRFSDTKLLDSTETDTLDPILYKTNINAENNEISTSKRVRQLLKQHSATAADTVLDIELPTSPLSPPAAYAGQCQQIPTLRRSMQTFEVGGLNLQQNNPNCNTAQTAQQIDKARLFFKSLPNLSNSCENLLRK